MITVTCGCGRLRQQRRCGASKAVTSKGQVQQPERLPSLTPLNCDDECTRLERNRSLASALGIDINPSTTVQAFTSSNLPYSTETLDQYVKLASSVPLSTLQTYEATLHSLATDPTNRSVRFQPAKSTLRSYSHSLATDWGFNTESHDPEPHRHVFVLKPLAWTPPVFGMGTGSSIGIGGMSVRECVKLRERELTKERDAQRAAALEAKAARDAAKTQAGSDGWAQSSFTGRTMFSALDQNRNMPSDSKKERLVLRSGVGTSKTLRSQPPAEIFDSWEDAEEKEEEEERQDEKMNAERKEAVPQETQESSPEVLEVSETPVPEASAPSAPAEQDKPVEASEVPTPDLMPVADVAYSDA
ncbi:uncharacterized protein N7477_002879 [Penicillium maclennaniae]|uniref:uncharacterized protein n=1 Tax=Penicillium maclennaniae TaxID=1343394 RepID=UPI002540842F|nr:uncharacterized protein N7477_002879 [Penicillium maclennaniae]KAJ5677246.1 hypothetical protein N7477_002879 [Penicillium maclennaniae]